MTLLLTGAAGFVGSAVRRRLALAGRPVRCLVHERLPEPTGPADPAHEAVRGDLTDPASLRGLLDGVDVVLHAAAAVEGDEAHCTVVNDVGTAALLAEAERAGVGRVVLLSTAAVYGDGVFAGIGPDDAEPRPVSAASRSRLAAERHVLAAGGTVLRPMYVYGPGDRWFVPSVALLGRALPYLVNGGRARLSTVAVDDLAALLLAAADGRLPAGVHHADHPEPVTLATILDVLRPHLGLLEPQGEKAYADVVSELGLDGELARKLAHITSDRWFASAEVWRQAGVDPGPAFPARFAAYADAYREALAPAG